MIATRSQPEIGGIESHVGEVAGRIVARGHDLELLTTDRSGKLPKRFMNSSGVLKNSHSLRGSRAAVSAF